ncbi:sn-glycerol-3-phosphate import ATP-binding protein UgpC [bioreactor metagenome]|uniref:sn-glycerol-3-phosphate import ATP-binding protein UgpC n=1 Tax=bioreactor metagenome TaxID=1076179 RepID=A0A644YI05_9ZZZZ|nr:ABC transporter ATP-binding protein [Erysipelotrichaceae bacterium]
MKIRVENLTKKYGKTIAVSNFNANIEEGKLVTLLGPSGCGKSTILYALSGITTIDTGSIYFDQIDVSNLSPEKRNIGLVFQNYALYPHLTVMDNICFPLEIQRIVKAERIKRALAIAKVVHLEDLLDRKPAELSGGQQQRVAIARALVKKPNLLLLDEPLSNLDARLRLEMREEIRRIQQEMKVTTIFVTHDQEEAMSISDQIILLKDGVIQQVALPQQMYDDPQNTFVADFLGNPPINKLYGYFENNQFILHDHSASCHLFEKIDLPENYPVVLSIRPEAIEKAEGDQNSAFTAVAGATYQVGKERLVYLRFGSANLRAYIDQDYGLQEGKAISIFLQRKGVFLFDQLSGVRIR